MAIDLVSWTIAPFAALYEGMSPDPKNEYILPMLIIFPPLRPSIDWAASFERRKTALSCVSITLSQSSDFSCNTPPLSDTLPALLTRMSMPPSSLSTLLSAGSNPARLVTSSLTATDRTPIALNSESTRWFFSSLRPNTATAAPASANPSAMPRPIPPLPPVTTATRPVKSNSAGVFIKHSPFSNFWSGDPSGVQTCLLSTKTKHRRVVIARCGDRLL